MRKFIKSSVPSGSLVIPHFNVSFSIWASFECDPVSGGSKNHASALCMHALLFAWMAASDRSGERRLTHRSLPRCLEQGVIQRDFHIEQSTWFGFFCVIAAGRAHRCSATVPLLQARTSCLCFFGSNCTVVLVVQLDTIIHAPDWRGLPKCSHAAASTNQSINNTSRGCK